MRKLWEILIPIADNDGVRFKPEQHREWDNIVRKMSGGLTIFKPATGEWINANGAVMRDKLIPVAFMADDAQARAISAMSKGFYKQEAMMLYVLSETVFIE